jgi:hypothetical protein
LKEHTHTLIERAAKDLSNAKGFVRDDPASAAVYAQQCAEKSVKAVAYELGNYRSPKQFDRMAAKWGHDSALVCLSILKGLGEEIWQTLGFKELVAKQKATSPKNPLATVGVVVGQYFIETYEKFLRDIEESPYKKNEGYWFKSLDPGLKPHPSVSDNLARAVKDDEERLDMSFKSIFGLLGVLDDKTTRALDNIEKQGNWLKMFDILETRFRELGDKADALIISRQKGLFERLFGPDLALVTWLDDVVPWLPYLDSHSIEGGGKYADAKHAKIYESRKDGIANLVMKAEMIHNETLVMLKAFDKRST